MREAKIILPLVGNKQEDIGKARERALNSIEANWGGYTKTTSIGKENHWAQEYVSVVHVAMEDTAGNIGMLRHIAKEFCRDAKQRSVYIVLPDGNVEFVTA